MSNQDPFELLQSHVPFSSNENEGHTDAATKAAMYKEILMQTETIDRSTPDRSTTKPFRPSQGAPTTTSRRSTGRWGSRRTGSRRSGLGMAAAAVVVVVLALVATLAPLPGTNGDIAFAMDTLDRTAQATSGRVEVTQVDTQGTSENTASTIFIFDGDDAHLTVAVPDAVDRQGVIVNGVGYKNYVASDTVGAFTSSELFDRRRILGRYDDNLASVGALRSLLERGENVTRTRASDGTDTESITMQIQVDAGPGETFDFEGYESMPTEMMVSPFGNFRIDISITISDGFIDVLTYTAVGTRPSSANPAVAEAFRASGSITFSDIDQPQTITAPADFTIASGINEWVLLDGGEWAAHDNLRLADDELAGLCSDFGRNWEALLGPLSDAQMDNFQGLADCFWDENQQAVAQSIRSLIELNN